MTTTESPAPSTAASDFAIDTEQLTPSQYIRNYIDRLRGGELGSLPAVLGLIVLTVVFALTASAFWSSRNFANLLTQATPVVLIGIGLTFVLLLGEIDLSAGATAGVAATLMAYLAWSSSRGHDLTPWLAMAIAIIVAMGIGLLNGWLVARVGIPSFVVTLAFFLTYQGVTLEIAKEGGTIPIEDRNKVIIAIANKNMPIWMGWLLFLLVVIAYAFTSFARMAGRRRRGLQTQPLLIAIAKIAAVAIGWGVATYVLSLNRGIGKAGLKGVPWAVPFVLVVTVILTYMLGRTAWGRHMYAVGGNAEAARRAGIPVSRIRMSGFVMCSTMAALGGFALASQLNSVSPQTGGNDTVLLAVAAAVIGGTSLFGGRGKVSNAVIGGLVVAMIPNGMALLGTKTVLGFTINFSESGVKFITTGLVLLLAASVDALSRKRSVAR
jgi:D-xylose transport system permease protein